MNNGGRNGWGEATSIRKFREAKRSRRREREKKRIDGCITKRSMVIEGRGEITKSRRFAKRVGIVGYGAVKEYILLSARREREREREYKGERVRVVVEVTSALKRKYEP